MPTATSQHILHGAKALIFDCDGLLIDSEPWQFKARYLAARMFGQVLTETEFLYFWFDGNGGSKAYCAKVGIDFKAFDHAKHALYDQFIESGIELCPGVRDFLKLVQGRYHLALCSNSVKSDLQKVLMRFSLENVFTTIISGNDLKHGKPDPEGFLLAAKKSDATPAESVVFENSHIGLMAAKAAGMRCVIVPDALGSKFKFGAADLVVQRIDEVGVG